MAPQVLLVDDEKHVVNVVRAMLEQRSLEVVVATSGEEALTMLEEKLPDLLLLDIMLPGIDGATLANKVKELPGAEQIPVIFLTGLVDPGEVQRGGNEIGGQYFLAKPFDAKELFSVIDRAMAEA